MFKIVVLDREGQQYATVGTDYDGYSLNMGADRLAAKFQSRNMAQEVLHLMQERLPHMRFEVETTE